MLVEQHVGQEAYEGALNPRLAVDEDKDEERKEKEGYQEEGVAEAHNGFEPVDACE